MAIILPVHDGEEVTISPSKIICLGLNYLDHIRESDSLKVQNFTNEVPQEPVLFPKTPNVLIGPEERIVLPDFLHEYGFDDLRTDYEGELAFVIKDRIKNLPAKEAMDHILGFTCFNDVSQRNLQRGDKSGWWRGKSLDTFGPMGPVLVPPEVIGDVGNLEITTRLNGRPVQHANTRQMIFDIPTIVAYISKNFTLEPGDIISTGTPAGVGPLQAGDVVEVEIEKIGVLRNPVSAG